MSCPYCGGFGGEQGRNCPGCLQKHHDECMNHPELIPPPLTLEDYTFDIWKKIQEIKFFAAKEGRPQDEVKREILTYAKEVHEEKEKGRRLAAQMRPAKPYVYAEDLSDYNFDYTADGIVTVPQVPPRKPKPVYHPSLLKRILRKIDDYFFGF